MSGALGGAHVGLLTASASRLGGGVFEAVAAQAALIRTLGGRVTVFALDDAHAAADRGRFDGAEVRLERHVGPGQIGFAPGLVEALCGADLDLLHLHGIWMYPSRAAQRWAARTGRLLIISPHGMLDPWITARGRWKKALARIGYERAAWRAAHAFHALTGDEAADIARESGRSDSIVIPNAAPAVIPGSGSREPECVYIGRIHSKKNLLTLVAAWRQARRPQQARLTIAGWGADEDVAALTAAVEAAGPSVRFIGPIFGADKDALIARARYVVLPSLSEGLPMAVLEAWARGTPTIMTEACHLPEGFAAGAALPCPTDAPGLARALEGALGIDNATWAAHSAAAANLAGGQFSAARISRQWADAYCAAIEAKP